MSDILMVEQASMTAQAASQQTLYPKAGALARMDSTGVEKIILDSSTYAAAAGALLTQSNYLGL